MKTELKADNGTPAPMARNPAVQCSRPENKQQPDGYQASIR